MGIGPSCRRASSLPTNSGSGSSLRASKTRPPFTCSRRWAATRHRDISSAGRSPPSISQGGSRTGCHQRCWQREGLVSDPLDAVQDEIEPVLEFVTVLVARLHGAVDRHLSEVGILAGPEPLHDVSRYLGDACRSLGGAEWQ